VLVDSLLPHIAGELGLQIVAPLKGGEFGATLVRDREGQQLILKAVPGAALQPQFARAAALSERLRARGYPAPLYVATGSTRGVSWSLQERLPGTPPCPVTEPHARRLIELVRTHAGAADRPSDWHREALRSVRSIERRLARQDVIGAAVAELARIAQFAVDGIGETDVVHNDFSHRNCLAQGDSITGIIDWEQATGGDWRFDLVTLAYWARLEPRRVPAAARRIIEAALQKECPARLRATFAACQALRHLDYEVRAHPGRLIALHRRLEARVADLWRP
jgi:aminoglycoside phosphotransferase (APT) family kinase protein